MGSLDVTLKHAVTTFPEDWAEFLGVTAGTPVELVDADLSTLTAVADKVLIVRTDPPYVLHFEPQSYYDEAQDERMLVYHVVAGRNYRMPVHTLVMLLSPRASGPAIRGGVQRQSPLPGCTLDFRYQMIRLWELSTEALLQAGVGVLPLAPLDDATEKELPAVIDRMNERFDRELSPRRSRGNVDCHKRAARLKI